MSTPKPPPGTIEFRSPDAATPMRVQEMVRVSIDILEAAEIDQDCVTLVVSNLAMRAQVRPQSESALKGMQIVSSVLQDPLAAVQRFPAARGIALAISSAKLDKFPGGLDAFHWSPERDTSAAKVRAFDRDFIRTAKAIGEGEREVSRAVHGNTQIYTKVLRVGRSTEADESPKARLIINGRSVEIPIAQRASTKTIYAALESGAVVRISLDARWLMSSAGESVLVPSETLVVDVSPWSPITGKEFLSSLTSLESEITEEDVEDLRGGEE